MILIVYNQFGHSSIIGDAAIVVVIIGADRIITVVAIGMVAAAWLDVVGGVHVVRGT